MDRVKIAEAECTPAPQPALLKPPREPDVSFGVILTLAAACGLIAANIYYAQLLIAEIARSPGGGRPDRDHVADRLWRWAFLYRSARRSR